MSNDQDARRRPNVDSLVREIRAGQSSNGPFEQLFRYYLPSVIRFFRTRGVSKPEAEDLAQTVFLSVYRNVGGFRFESSFDTWLFRIVSNTWKNALRRQGTLEGRTQKVPVDELREEGRANPTREVVEPSDPQDDPCEHLLADERNKLLDEAIHQLPPKMRQCVLFRMGGLRYSEIADVMGISETTVKTHLQNARQRLKPLLEEHFDVVDF